MEATQGRGHWGPRGEGEPWGRGWRGAHGGGPWVGGGGPRTHHTQQRAGARRHGSVPAGAGAGAAHPWYPPLVWFWILLGLAYFASILTMIGNWLRALTQRTRAEVLTPPPREPPREPRDPHPKELCPQPPAWPCPLGSVRAPLKRPMEPKPCPQSPPREPEPPPGSPALPCPAPQGPPTEPGTLSAESPPKYFPGTPHLIPYFSPKSLPRSL